MKFKIVQLYQLHSALTTLDRDAPTATSTQPIPFDLDGKDLYTLGRNIRLIVQELRHFEEKRVSMQKDLGEPPAKEVEEAIKTAYASKQKELEAKLNEMGEAEVELDLRPFTLKGLGLDQSPARNKIPAERCLAVLIEHALLEEPK